jgi:hypothetical protein
MRVFQQDLPRRANQFVFSEMVCPAPFAKIFPFSADPNHFYIHHRLVPIRGAVARRHERGAGCGGRESVRRCQGMAGRVDKPRELTNGTQTNDALADGEAVWFWHPLLVSSSRRLVSLTGHRPNLNPRTTVARRIRRRGEHEISRKPLRGECRVISGGPVVTTLVCFV